MTRALSRLVEVAVHLAAWAAIFAALHILTLP